MAPLNTSFPLDGGSWLVLIISFSVIISMAVVIAVCQCCGWPFNKRTQEDIETKAAAKKTGKVAHLNGKTNCKSIIVPIRTPNQGTEEPGRPKDVGGYVKQNPVPIFAPPDDARCGKSVQNVDKDCPSDSTGTSLRRRIREPERKRDRVDYAEGATQAATRAVGLRTSRVPTIYG